MELKDILYGKRVYFDVNIFVYLLGGFKFSKPLNDLKDLILKREIEVVTCSLVFTQIIPICAPNEDLAVDFVRTFKPTRSDSVELMGVYREVDKMSQMRSTHVLSAIENKCDVFLTDDIGIQVPDNIKFVLFSDYENKLDQKPMLSGNN